MVITNRFQVLTREKLLFRTLGIPSLCRKPVEEISKNEFFSKVVPVLPRENSKPVIKRFPDIDRLFRLISEWMANSIYGGYFSFPGNISLIFIRSLWSKEAQEIGREELSQDCMSGNETFVKSPVVKYTPGFMTTPLWAFATLPVCTQVGTQATFSNDVFLSLYLLTQY